MRNPFDIRRTSLIPMNNCIRLGSLMREILSRRPPAPCVGIIETLRRHSTDETRLIRMKICIRLGPLMREILSTSPPAQACPQCGLNCHCKVRLIVTGIDSGMFCAAYRCDRHHVFNATHVLFYLKTLFTMKVSENISNKNMSKNEICLNIAWHGMATREIRTMCQAPRIRI